MVVNETLMQFQADILGVPVIRPVVAETTALGAAYAAGLAVGFWEGEDDIRDQLGRGQAVGAADGRRAEREKLYRKWKKAVTKTFDWVDDGRLSDGAAGRALPRSAACFAGSPSFGGRSRRTRCSATGRTSRSRTCSARSTTRPSAWRC